MFTKSTFAEVLSFKEKVGHILFVLPVMVTFLIIVTIFPSLGVVKLNLHSNFVEFVDLIKMFKTDLVVNTLPFTQLLSLIT